MNTIPAHMEVKIAEFGERLAARMRELKALEAAKAKAPCAVVIPFPSRRRAA
ncbi:hypothetical protein [Stenotrophomonas sp. 278]|uniref:hypothetical protein n=1 Tax=Stenotrophomonas sp. 278 TaxID=2479851 RepID=UPI001639A79A|nr:hypothetical protein [Stenotrophomonas sp. 278]